MDSFIARQTKNFLEPSPASKTSRVRRNNSHSKLEKTNNNKLDFNQSALQELKAQRKKLKENTKSALSSYRRHEAKQMLSNPQTQKEKKEKGLTTIIIEENMAEMTSTAPDLNIKDPEQTPSQIDLTDKKPVQSETPDRK